MARDRTESLLRVRRIAQQQALADMAGAMQDEAAAAAAAAAARRLLDAHVSHALDTAALRVERSAGIALRHGLDTAEAHRRGAASERDDRTAAWQQARARERAVERLVDRRRRSALVAAQAADQARADELALLVRREDRP